jgi:hypothetical protein
MAKRTVKIMKRNLLFFVVFLSVAAGSVIGQTRTVTNADLEKFRQERLKAEKDYRENYARLGFPSPEELQRRSEQSSKETSELAAKFRAEARERQRLEAERRRQAGSNILLLNTGGWQYSSPYYNYPIYGNFYPGRGRRNFNSIPYNSNTPLVLRMPRFDWLPGSILPSRSRGRRY